VILDSFRIEISKDQLDWSYPDLVVDAARNHGLNVLLTVSYSPEWALPQGATWSAPPEDTGAFAAFVGAAANRYMDRVDSWEIWNEPNSQHYFSYSGDGVERYAEILKASYVAIKSEQPNSTVLAAGLSPMGEVAPPEFIERLYGAGAKDYFDAVGAHPYVWQGGLAADPHNGWSDVGRIHTIMSAHGDGDKQIWMTEFGAPTIPGPVGVSEADQAAQIVEVLQAAAETSFSGPAFIFTIRDAPGREGQPDYTFGALLTSDWRPKEAAAKLAADDEN
jgi:hypothetical protein